MTLRTRILTTAGAIALIGPASAAVATTTLDVRGLAAPQLRLQTAARLADGGALLGGALRQHGRSHAFLARVKHTGALDPRWAADGLRVIDSAAGEVTALAIGSGTKGHAWAAGSARGTVGAFVASLGPDGRRASGFGSDGVVILGPAVDGPAVDGPARAVAVVGSRILVAAGRTPCAGCTVVSLDATSGRVLGTVTVSPTLQAASDCPGATVDSLLAVGDGVRLGGSAGPPGSCDPALVTFGAGVTTSRRLAPGTERLVLARGLGAGRSCMIRQAADSIDLDAAASEVRFSSRPGRVLQAIATSERSCAALVGSARTQRRVAILNRGGAAVAVRLPGGQGAQTAFRCRHDLLVFGTRPRRDGHRQAIVSVVGL